MPPSLIWAQTIAPAPGVEPFAVAKIALKRFFSGSTLSAPEPVPSSFPLVAVICGLVLLALVGLLFQGPGHALRQLFDLPGHWKAWRDAAGRFRRAGRLVAVLFGSAVLSWTVWQSRFYAQFERLEELSALLKRKSVGELSIEQGLLAALVPLRDIGSLSGNLVLLIAASALIFKVSADRWNMYDDDFTLKKPHRLPPWTTIAWGAVWLLTLYRIAAHVWRPQGHPISQFPIPELLLVPLFMLTCDGLLLSWVLTELRNAQSDSVSPPITTSASQAIERLPAAACACLLVLPARYLAPAAWILVACFAGSPPPSLQRPLATLLIDWGLVWLQIPALALVPCVAAVAYAGIRRGFFQVCARTLRLQAARIFASTVACMFAIFTLTTLAYMAVLSLPAQPWVLAAADSYAHYISLPLGLLLVAILVELADRSTQDWASQPSADESQLVLEVDVSKPAAFIR